MLKGAQKRAVVLAALMLGCSGQLALGQDQQTAEAAIEKAAEALGGVDAILGVKTLHLYGYAQLAYQWGGGNITADPEAPQKWTATNALERIWDLENGRYLNQHRNSELFPFAAYSGHAFGLVTRVLDGDIAFNRNADGTASRVAMSAPGARETDGVYDRTMWSLSNPVTAVRAVLADEAEVSNLRQEDGFEVVDITVDLGTLQLALEEESGLPHHVKWSTAQSNLGQVEYTVNFVGYAPFDGIKLPLGITTVLDWRDLKYHNLFVDGWVVNGDIPDLAAPAEIAAADMPSVTAPPLEVEQVAERIWRITNGSTVIEFDDHMTLFELGGNQVAGKAVIELAKTINADKPLTELIVSHHHFDHTGGFRAAIAEGLSVYGHENIEQILVDLATRPAPDFNDALPEGGTLDFAPISEPTDIGDPDFPLILYPLVANNHMGAGIFAYQPDSKVMIEGDIGTAAEELQWWGDSYLDNLDFYDLEVERISPAHMRIFEHDDLVRMIGEGVARVHQWCEDWQAKDLYFTGCPAFLDREY